MIEFHPQRKFSLKFHRCRTTYLLHPPQHYQQSNSTCLITSSTKNGDSVSYHPNNNGTNLEIKNMYANARINWMMNHGTLKLTPDRMNSILFKIWEAFTMSNHSITHDYFKKTQLIPLYPPDQDTNLTSFPSR